MDELPDDMKLRRDVENTEPDVPAGGPKFVTPKTHDLQIRVGEEEEDDEAEDEAGAYSEMAEQIDNPYLLHYKNQSKMLKQELMAPTVPMTPSHDPQRDPEEEFFMLAVLALKMLHNEQYEDAEYVYEVSAAKLFKQVRSQKMPFHRWYKWLERKFSELRDAFKKQSADKNDEELLLWQREVDSKEVENEHNKRRTDSTTNAKRASGFFKKLKNAMKKKEKKDVELNFAREHVGSTPKKIDPQQLRAQQETSAEKALKTISESMQGPGEF